MTDEALIARLRDLGDHASFVPHMHHTAADRIEALTKERDAYAECDRIGTQAVRDLEAKAREKALREAAEILDDEGWLGMSKHRILALIEAPNAS